MALHRNLALVHRHTAAINLLYVFLKQGLRICLGCLRSRTYISKFEFFTRIVDDNRRGGCYHLFAHLISESLFISTFLAIFATELLNAVKSNKRSLAEFVCLNKSRTCTLGDAPFVIACFTFAVRHRSVTPYTSLTT